MNSRHRWRSRASHLIPNQVVRRRTMIVVWLARRQRRKLRRMSVRLLVLQQRVVKVLPRLHCLIKLLQLPHLWSVLLRLVYRHQVVIKPHLLLYLQLRNIPMLPTTRNLCLLQLFHPLVLIHRKVHLYLVHNLYRLIKIKRRSRLVRQCNLMFHLHLFHFLILLHLHCQSKKILLRRYNNSSNNIRVNRCNKKFLEGMMTDNWINFNSLHLPRGRRVKMFIPEQRFSIRNSFRLSLEILPSQRKCLGSKLMDVEMRCSRIRVFFWSYSTVLTDAQSWWKKLVEWTIHSLVYLWSRPYRYRL